MRGWRAVAGAVIVTSAHLPTLVTLWLLAACGDGGSTSSPTPEPGSTDTPGTTEPASTGTPEPGSTGTPEPASTGTPAETLPPGESPTPASSPTPVPQAQLALQDVLVHDGEFIAAGGLPCATLCPASGLDDGVILRSTDGATWHLVSTPAHNRLTFVAHSDATLLAGGYQHGTNEAGQLELFSSLLRAVDPDTWTALPLPDGLERPYDAAYGDGRFVLIGETAQDGVGAWVSDDDGDTWTCNLLGPLWWSPQVAWAEDRFFIYGEGPSIAFSETGSSWEAADLNMTAVGWLGPLDGAVHGSSYYDCCFGEQPAAIRYFHLETTTGIAWDIDELDDRLMLYGLVAGEGAYVGFDRSRIYQLEGAVDAWSWTPVPGGGFGGGYPWALAHNGETFVLVGEQLLLYSADGSSWLDGALESGG